MKHHPRALLSAALFALTATALTAGDSPAPVPGVGHMKKAPTAETVEALCPERAADDTTAAAIPGLSP